MYSAYSHEQEYLLMEGFWVKVLKIEEGVVIENDIPALHDYNGKTLTVVYLLNNN